MNWKAFLNSLATAAVSGAVVGLAGHYTDPTFAGTGVGGAAAAGAVIGVINLFRQHPLGAPAPPPAAPVIQA